MLVLPSASPNLRGYQPPSAVDNTLWISTSNNPISKNPDYGRRFMSDTRRKKQRLLPALFFVVFALTAVIFHDNEYQPRNSSKRQLPNKYISIGTCCQKLVGWLDATAANASTQQTSSQREKTHTHTHMWCSPDLIYMPDSLKRFSYTQQTLNYTTKWRDETSAEHSEVST